MVSRNLTYSGTVDQALSVLGSNLIRVWGFNNQTKEWTFFDPRPEVKGFSTLENLGDTDGYIITVREAQNININNIDRTLYAGKNYIGRPTTRPLIASSVPGEAFRTLGINLGRLWHFDASTQNEGPDFGWYFYDSRPVFAAANTVREMVPDEPYWLWVMGDHIGEDFPFDLHDGWNLITWYAQETGERLGVDQNEDVMSRRAAPPTEITLSPSEGRPGDQITVTGIGLAVFNTVNLYIGNLDVTPSPKPATGFRGEFSANFTLPQLDNGTHRVRAEVGSTMASAAFRVGDDPNRQSWRTGRLIADSTEPEQSVDLPIPVSSGQLDLVGLPGQLNNIIRSALTDAQQNPKDELLTKLKDFFGGTFAGQPYVDIKTESLHLTAEFENLFKVGIAARKSGDEYIVAFKLLDGWNFSQLSLGIIDEVLTLRESSLIFAKYPPSGSRPQLPQSLGMEDPGLKISPGSLKPDVFYVYSHVGFKGVLGEILKLIGASELDVSVEIQTTPVNVAVSVELLQGEKPLVLVKDVFTITSLAAKIKYTDDSLAIVLTGKINLKIGSETLILDCSLQADSDNTQRFALSLPEAWEIPMGLEGLTIKDFNMALVSSEAGQSFELSGTFALKKLELSVAGAYGVTQGALTFLMFALNAEIDLNELLDSFGAPDFKPLEQVTIKKFNGYIVASGKTHEVILNKKTHRFDPGFGFTCELDVFEIAVAFGFSLSDDGFKANGNLEGHVNGGFGTATFQLECELQALNNAINFVADGYFYFEFENRDLGLKGRVNADLRIRFADPAYKARINVHFAINGWGLDLPGIDMEMTSLDQLPSAVATMIEKEASGLFDEFIGLLEDAAVFAREILEEISQTDVVKEASCALKEVVSKIRETVEKLMKDFDEAAQKVFGAMLELLTSFDAEVEIKAIVEGIADVTDTATAVLNRTGEETQKVLNQVGQKTQVFLDEFKNEAIKAKEGIENEYDSWDWDDKANDIFPFFRTVASTEPPSELDRLRDDLIAKGTQLQNAYVDQFKISSIAHKKHLKVIHRHWSEALSDHYLSSDSVVGNLWSYVQEEEESFYVLSEGVEGTVPLYEYRSGLLKDHFYTLATEEEVKGAGNPDAYEFTQILGYVFPIPEYGPQAVPGMLPLRTYVSPQDHMYSVHRHSDEDMYELGYEIKAAECNVIPTHRISEFSEVKDYLVKIYRYFSKPLSDHYFSRDPVIGNLWDYDDEGESFLVLSSASIPRVVPLNQYRSGLLTDHYYTLATEDEVKGAGNPFGYELTGKLGYVFPPPEPGSEPAPGTVPLNRYMSPLGDHNYSVEEYSEEIHKAFNYEYEGVECYVIPITTRTYSGYGRYTMTAGRDIAIVDGRSYKISAVDLGRYAPPLLNFVSPNRPIVKGMNTNEWVYVHDIERLQEGGFIVDITFGERPSNVKESEGGDHPPYVCSSSSVTAEWGSEVELDSITYVQLPDEQWLVSHKWTDTGIFFDIYRRRGSDRQIWSLLNSQDIFVACGDIHRYHFYGKVYLLEITSFDPMEKKAKFIAQID